MHGVAFKVVSEREICTAEVDLKERRELAVITEGKPRPKHVGERFSAKSIRKTGQLAPSQVRRHAEPRIQVIGDRPPTTEAIKVLRATTRRIANVHECRRCLYRWVVLSGNCAGCHQQ